MPDTSVKYFDSTMSGAPALSGQAGKLIAILDACLQDGFGTVTLNSLVVSGNVATGTVNAGHGFAMLGTTGPVITVAGATPSGLNGVWRIASVPSSTTFTFATSGISDQTATGTITAKRTQAGYTKVYSATNKAAYRSDGVAGTRPYLRVDDTPTNYPTLIQYESMSGIDTGSGPAPASGSYYFGKSSTADSTARAWRLFSDGRTVYFFAKNDGTNWYGAMDWGDIVPYKSGDAYCALLHAVTSATYIFAYYDTSAQWGVLARSYTQLGAAVAAKAHSHGKSTALGANGQAYPAPADNAFHGWPVEVWEGASGTLARGLMPGLWNPIHVYPLSSGPPDGTIVSSVPQLSGRNLFVQSLYNGGAAVAIDITGPWR